MEVSKEVSEYMANMARTGNKQRSTEAYQKAAKKGWIKRRKRVIPKPLAHGE